jgi:hypothetical protein
VLAATYLDEARRGLADLLQIAGPAGPGPGRGPRLGGHPRGDGPCVGWVRTDERFRDPTSKAIMRVWVDSSTDPETCYYLPDGE